jgi:signal transduction histidine kinase
VTPDLGGRERAEHACVRALAVVGHELRNPLAAAVAMVGAAAELTEPTDPRAPFLERAQAELERTASLLAACTELLGGGRPESRTIDLCGVLGRIESRRPGMVRAACAPDAAWACAGSEVLVERALDNLVENAAAAGASHIAVDASLRQGRVVLCVSDDGPGVPPALRDRLFEPFVSGRGSSGLGLFVVRSVARRHGGTVRLRPTPRGACFEVTLPARSAACASRATA